MPNNEDAEFLRHTFLDCLSTTVYLGFAVGLHYVQTTYGSTLPPIVRTILIGMEIAFVPVILHAFLRGTLRALKAFKLLLDELPLQPTLRFFLLERHENLAARFWRAIVQTVLFIILGWCFFIAGAMVVKLLTAATVAVIGTLMAGSLPPPRDRDDGQDDSFSTAVFRFVRFVKAPDVALRIVHGLLCRSRTHSHCALGGADVEIVVTIDGKDYHLNADDDVALRAALEAMWRLHSPLDEVDASDAQTDIIPAQRQPDQNEHRASPTA